jgi:hypothetical protein
VARPPSAASPAAAAQSTAAARSTLQASPARVTRSAAAPAPAPLPRPRVRITRVRTADGTRVTIATFLGPVRYVLHNGSADPGPAASGRVRAGPAVTGAERRQLLAAFNGGFKLSAGAGGYMQEGHVISPLRPGFASLVIDRSGYARIGVWGSGLPAPGEAVYSVRQDLRPLVLNGRPTGAPADWTLWGATLGGGAYLARSAIGRDAAGHLMYAAGMWLRPPVLWASSRLLPASARNTGRRSGSSRRCGTHRPSGPAGGRTPHTMPASATTGWYRTSASPASRSARCQNSGVAGCSGPTRRP